MQAISGFISVPGPDPVESTERINAKGSGPGTPFHRKSTGINPEIRMGCSYESKREFGKHMHLHLPLNTNYKIKEKKFAKIKT